MGFHLVHLMHENLVVVIDLLLDLQMESNLVLMKELHWVLQMDSLIGLMMAGLRARYWDYYWGCMLMRLCNFHLVRRLGSHLGLLRDLCLAVWWASTSVQLMARYVALHLDLQMESNLG